MAIPIALISQVADILLLTLSLMQKVTGKTREEVLKAIVSEEIKTNELLKKLR